MITYDKVSSDIMNKVGKEIDNIKPNEDGYIELVRVGGKNENPIYGYTTLDGKICNCGIIISGQTNTI